MLMFSSPSTSGFTHSTRVVLLVWQVPVCGSAWADLLFLMTHDAFSGSGFWISV